MSRVELAPEVGEDFERIFDHLAQFDVPNISLRLQEIIQAIAVLEHNPLIGRPVNALNDDKRELIIGRHARGYVALYRYIAEIDTVFVLALRGQREVGYSK
ncbi:MAG: type II toxin-antitoxin system RelE/ParE family toxin [Candidatus Thermoplasmatota archaeon]|nr:type II toxin-antitoxin system RelE/ParE family toxin [Candidatus Thermoplasmatota archaeon]